MSNALKGALLSGLIFPGLGQVVLKHYTRGAVVILTVLASMTAIAVKAAQLAFAILEEIELESGIISMSTILNAATEASTNSGSLTFNLLFLMILICWIIGTIDAYRIGRKKDIEDLAAMPRENRVKTTAA